MSAEKTGGNQVELILFDWDGFFAKSLHVWLGAFQTAYSSFNLRPNNAEISSLFGDWDKAYCLTNKNDIERLNKTAKAIAIPKLENVALYEGAKETIDLVSSLRLKGSLGGAVLWTGSHYDAIQNPLKHHGIADLFDRVITQSDHFEPKPNPEAIGDAAKKLDLDIRPEQVVVFGDTNKDVLSAKNFGARSALFLPPDNREIYGAEQVASFQKLLPDYIVHSHLEVQQLLLELISNPTS